MEDFLAPVREAGGGVHLKPVFNDYVYFWRWALWKVLDSSDDAGMVTFVTASSYLRGPGFAGMRQKMREVFDELWIIDLGGDNLGTRKTENVFAIQIPVAIAIGVRDGSPRPETPAKVWKTRLTGAAQVKLESLEQSLSFDDYQWSLCAQGWDAPFHPVGTGSYFDWPLVTNIFPWQHTGAVLYRTWPIGPTKELLAERWQILMAQSRGVRQTAFRETRDRKVDGQYPALTDPSLRQPAISALNVNTPVPVIARYSFRTLDRQWVIADSRVGDYMRPELWRVHGRRQVYMVGMLVQVPGIGPAMTACSGIPDQHHFRGSFGDRGVIPLWRNIEGTQPNVTKGSLEAIAVIHGRAPSAEELFSYAYGLLAQPAYVERFWDELELPPPRLPITKNHDLFRRVAKHGSRLLYLHTYGDRFRGPKDDGSAPQGEARCTKAVPHDKYPEGFSYDPQTKVLTVGEGEFAPVKKEIWGYSVSGFQVVKSWLGYRKLKGSGRKSSELDNIRPESWEFTEELLELLWVLEETINLQPEGAALLEDVCASDLFSGDELPTPSDEERKPPRNAPEPGSQIALPSSDPL